ncbi:MAG: VWA domain-containing protein [Gammaproteobacteria bacterium]|nr:VWA domain-containing protein [Gammaproteobacteria bacterium]
MRKKRRENEAFSISFLDVITCGFGAIILLLMIAKTGDSPILETAVDSMHGIVRQLQVQLFEIRGEARILNRELDAKHEQRSEWEQRVARLEAELIKEELRYNSVRDDSAVGVIIKGEFELALQQLTEEMKRLLAQQDRVRTDLIGGIPVDSEYVIFIIDTSGSMVNYHWENMIKQLITTLNVYPRLKGIQIMSDMGEYLFSRYRRTWIPDTEGRRKVIINTLRSWRAFSNSSPVEGITTAIRSFYDPGKKISIYVYGDEFTGPSIREVLDQVERINPKDKDGNTRVRIHAVGFPVPTSAGEHFLWTNKRYASLMRELTHNNGGAYVGLNDTGAL